MIEPIQMLDQHKMREDSARATLSAIGRPDRPMTVGKHEAGNHVHLQRVLAEADQTCPRAADTIRWLIWHDVLDAQIMHAMAKQAYKAQQGEQMSAPLTHEGDT